MRYPILAGFAFAAIQGIAGAQDKAPLELSQKIELEGVQGKFDHLAVDVQGKRLFVAAKEGNILVVIDLALGKVVHKIDGLAEPQGVAFLADLKRIAVANGDDGSCRFYDGGSYKLLKSVDLMSNVIMNPFDPLYSKGLSPTR